MRLTRSKALKKLTNYEHGQGGAQTPPKFMQLDEKGVKQVGGTHIGPHDEGMQDDDVLRPFDVVAPDIQGQARTGLPPGALTTRCILIPLLGDPGNPDDVKETLIDFLRNSQEQGLTTLWHNSPYVPKDRNKEVKKEEYKFSLYDYN